MSVACTAVVYRYDGSFDGFLTCVFESFARREIPAAIRAESDGEEQLSLSAEAYIPTDPVKAARVRRSIPEKISPQAAYWVRACFLSDRPERERLLLDFLRLGYRCRSSVCRCLSDPTVDAVRKAVLSVENESHLLKGFIRFSEYRGALVTVIHPKNSVLPFLRSHFCDRYPNEDFLIYDATHLLALISQKGKAGYLPLESFELPDADEDEFLYRSLWRKYYETIAVEGRENPLCCRTHLPLHFRKDMTEFSTDEPLRQKQLAGK